MGCERVLVPDQSQHIVPARVPQPAVRRGQRGIHHGAGGRTVFEIGQHEVGGHLPIPHLVAADGFHPRLLALARFHQGARPLRGDVRLAQIALRPHLLITGGTEREQMLQAVDVGRPGPEAPQPAHQQQGRRRSAVPFPRRRTLGGGLQLRQAAVEGVGRLDAVHILFVLLHLNTPFSCRRHKLRIVHSAVPPLPAKPKGGLAGPFISNSSAGSPGRGSGGSAPCRAAGPGWRRSPPRNSPRSRTGAPPPAGWRAG